MFEQDGNSEDSRIGWRIWAACAVAIALGVLFITLLCRVGAPFIHVAWLPYILWPVVSVIAVYFWHRHRADVPEKVNSVPEYSHMMAWALLSVLTLYLFSSAADDSWFYFPRWMPSDASNAYYPWFKYGLIRFCILTAALVPVLVFCRSRVSMWVITSGIMMWSQIACFNQLWHVTGGQALYGGEHPCSMYRLWTYAEAFPRLIYYDAMWNGGKEASYLVSTGIIPLGTLLMPLWKLFQVDLVYTPGLALAFMVIVPFLAGLSVRIVGGGWSAACCGSVLALGTSQYFFHWVLSVGSVGLCFALPFMMLVSACIYRVLWLDGFENWNGVVLVFAAAMFLAWPPSVIMMVSLLAAIVASARQLSVRKVLFLSLCFVSVAALCLPFVVGVFGYVDPSSLTSADPVRLASSGHLKAGWVRLCDHIRQGNPCLIFFGVLGVWFLPQKGMRAVYGVVITVLCLLAGWGDVLKPALHLSRSAIPMFFVSIIPAALWMARWLESTAGGMVIVRAAVLSILLLSGLNSMHVYGNKGPARYVTMSAGMSQLVDWTRKNGPENGRVLFVGSTAYEYGKGHIACLPILTGREMIAQDCFNVSTNAADGDFLRVPDSGKENELFDFAGLYNVNWIVTCDEPWKKFLGQHPDQYESLKSFGEKLEKTIFRVRQKANQFVMGSGVVKAGVNELLVKLDNPLEEAVLRYNWEDGLEAEAPIEIYPFDAGKNTRFIAVNPHGKSAFRISFKKLL